MFEIFFSYLVTIKFSLKALWNVELEKNDDEYNILLIYFACIILNLNIGVHYKGKINFCRRKIFKEYKNFTWDVIYFFLILYDIMVCIHCRAYKQESTRIDRLFHKFLFWIFLLKFYTVQNIFIKLEREIELIGNKRFYYRIFKLFVRFMELAHIFACFW